MTGVVFFDVLDQIPYPILVEGNDIKCFHVGKHKVIALTVEILHLPFVKIGKLDLVIRAFPAHGDGARLKVFQLELKHGAPVARGVQVAVDDRKELSVGTDDDIALSYLAIFNGGHFKVPFCGA